MDPTVAWSLVNPLTLLGDPFLLLGAQAFAAAALAAAAAAIAPVGVGPRTAVIAVAVGGRHRGWAGLPRAVVEVQW